MLIFHKSNNLQRANNKLYSIEEIHNLFNSWKDKYWDLAYVNPHKLQKTVEYFDGFPCKVYSQRYELFLTNTKCVNCGLEANCYILEKQDTAKAWHFNLYRVDGNNTILFTKDHILPRSKGGKNWLQNYQTMCYDCNQEKADRKEISTGVYIDNQDPILIDPSGEHNVDYMLNL